MIRKLSIIGGMAALLVTAFPAMAFGGGWNPPKPSSDIKNDVHIDAVVTNQANTGYNTQSNVNSVDDSRYVIGVNLGWGGNSRNMITGNAHATTNTTVEANVNTNLGREGGMWNWMPFFGGNNNKNNSEPRNDVHVKYDGLNTSNTGNNAQDDGNYVDDSCAVILGNVAINSASRNMETGIARSITNTTVRVNSNINTNVSMR